jgi:hypothetical protein
MRDTFTELVLCPDPTSPSRTQRHTGSTKSGKIPLLKRINTASGFFPCQGKMSAAGCFEIHIPPRLKADEEFT